MRWLPARGFQRRRQSQLSDPTKPVTPTPSPPHTDSRPYAHGNTRPHSHTHPEPTPTPTPTPSPTPGPTPTPSPTPVPGTDTKVVSVTVNAPTSGTTGVSFLVSGTANLHNNGPAAAFLWTRPPPLVLPAGCASPNNLTATVLKPQPAIQCLSPSHSKLERGVHNGERAHVHREDASTAISPGRRGRKAIPPATVAPART